MFFLVKNDFAECFVSFHCSNSLFSDEWNDWRIDDALSSQRNKATHRQSVVPHQEKKNEFRR